MSLTPGKKLTYITKGNAIYSQEENSDTLVLVGYNLPKRRDPIDSNLLEIQLWQDILSTSKTNKTLKKTLDRAILIYQTIKDNNE